MPSVEKFLSFLRQDGDGKNGRQRGIAKTQRSPPEPGNKAASLHGFQNSNPREILLVNLVRGLQNYTSTQSWAAFSLDRRSPNWEDVSFAAKSSWYQSSFQNI